MEPYPQYSMAAPSLPPTPAHQAAFRGGYGAIVHQKPRPQPQPQPPQIYTAVYSSVAVYEMDVNGVAVMRRRSDGWLNATQILKVAGVDKGKRTKILEKEILPGEHEKIQGGYGKYQGTWISYSRGREFCRQYGVEELLRPLLDYDTASDGHGASNIDTPTKEQALAASRKRFFNAQADQKMLATNENTYFQNISPTASNALAAMSKAARYDSPMPPRPSGGSSQHRLSASQQHLQPQYAQQSMHSFVSEGGHDQSMYAPINMRAQAENGQEPPRKRMKQAVAQDIYSQMDPMFHQSEVRQQQQEMTQAHYEQVAERGPVSLPPLPGEDKNFEEKRLALLDLFADSSRTDFSSHRAILNLSGEDLDTPLDPSANTALHWAAALARVGLMRLLISRGANIFRGNVVGQTVLMSAVQVNNSLDHSCFPEILDALGPLIEMRDAQGRTVLHHIAVSSGIKGRSISSRYYLESLLEFVVRSGSSQDDPNRPISLGRFMAEVVNVQDKAGNTALNLVARIGNRAIINQLDELGADFGIANFTGMKPSDFGVRSEKQGYRSSEQQQLQNSTSSTQSQAPTDGQAATKATSQIDQIKEEIFATTQSLLLQATTAHQTSLTKHAQTLDHQNAQLRATATQHKAEQESYDRLSNLVKSRDERMLKLENLRRSVNDVSRSLSAKGVDVNSNDGSGVGLGIIEMMVDPGMLSAGDAATLPSTATLRARLQAFAANNERLSHRLQALQARSGSSELEGKYKKVVALCTGQDEDRVPEMLEALLAAMESDAGGGNGGQQERIEEGRVREFLRKAEAV